MASVLNASNLTLNPEELRRISDIIVTMGFENPQIASLHKIYEGLPMKTQLVITDGFGDGGVKANGCERQTSGSSVELSQKYADPQKIEDTITNCQADLSQLFKAYYATIQTYREMYNIEGSDEFLFVLARLEEQIKASAWRLVWMGDKNVAAATSNTAGLISSTNAKFFSPIDGFFAQIFAGVTAGTVTRVDISALQSSDTITPANAYAKIQSVWAAADMRVRAAEDAIFYVSDSVFTALQMYLIEKSQGFTLGDTFNGLPAFNLFGKKVVNMGFVWDRISRKYFVNNTTSNATYLPHRIVFSTASNLAVATLNESETNGADVETWYSQDARQNKFAYGYTIDAVVLKNAFVTIAY